MKRLSLFIALLCVCVIGFAQTLDGEVANEITINLGSFAGIMAITSALVTQIAKLIPAINNSRLAKIGVSAIAGIVICVVAWALQISDPLMTLNWWQTLIYGLCAGLSGCGFYDLIKVIVALFKKE